MIPKTAKTILLVEDEYILALDEQMTLHDYGYCVIIAGSGEKAVEMVKTNSEIDLILMDINLGSGMEGTEAAKLILADHDIPLIFLSSHTERKVVEKTEGITSYGYIVKNTGETVMMASIKMAFRLFEAKMQEKEKEEALRKSEDRLSKIMLAANDGMWDWDLRTNEVYFDPRYYQMSGYKIDEFPHQLTEFQKRIFPDDVDYVMNEAEKHLKGEIDRFDVKFRFRKKSGDWHWIQGKGKIVERDEKGIPLRFVGTHRDISELKQIEEALRESNAKNAAILSASPDLLFINDQDGIFLDFFANDKSMLASDPEYFIGKSIQEILPQIADQCVKCYKSALATSKLQILEYFLDLPAGKRYYEARISALDQDRLLTIVRDITEAKLAEIALQQNEEKFKLLIQNMNEGLMQVDNADRIQFVNDKICLIFGYTESELLGRIGHELLILEEDWKTIKAKNKARLKNFSEKYEVRGRKKTGETIWLSISGSPILDVDGNIVGSVGILDDISEQKQAEAKLNEERKRLDFVMEVTSTHFNIIRGDFDLHHVDSSWQKIYGDPKGRKCYEYFMGQAEPCKSCGVPQALKTKQVVVSEEYLPHEDRSYIVHTIPFQNEEGEWLVAEFNVDISERKRAEDRLKEIKQELETYFDSSLDLLCIANTAGEFIRLNPEWKNVLGYSISELEGHKFLDFVHPEDLQATLDAVTRLDAQKEVLNFENRFRCKDGSYRWIEWRSKPQGSKIYAAARDISDRKQTEEELYQSLSLLNATLESTADGILVVDLKGKIVNFNQEFLKLWNIPKSSAFGKDDEELLSYVNDQLKDAPAFLQKVKWLYSNPSESSEDLIEFKDGRIYERYSQPQKLGNDIVGRVWSFRNITERKESEDRIKALLLEKEMLLKETHHRIKNNMAVVKGLLSLQARKLPDPNCQKALLDAASRVQSMVVLYNKLYRSDLYKELSIKVFLPPLIDEIMALFQTKKTVKTSVQIEDFCLPAKTLSSLAIIINECITNSMKYAFENSEEPIITVQVNRKKNTAHLIYADNGCGIADPASLQNSDTFGLSLINMLIEDLKGRFSIESDNGIRYIFEFTI